MKESNNPQVHIGYCDDCPCKNKFYCQHYTKGVECLGAHIKMDRIYPNNQVIRRAKVKARQFNRCIRENKIDSMLASINSYMGICKNTNGYNQARSIIRLLSRKWYKYVDFDRSRVCLTAKPEYKINNRIIRKFYETVRKR